MSNLRISAHVHSVSFAARTGCHSQSASLITRLTHRNSISRSVPFADAGHRQRQTCQHRPRVISQASSSDAYSALSRSAQAQEQEEDMAWATATITQNRNVSADGCMRALTISVEDPAHFLEGRKMPRRQDGARWIDAYKLPGQMVGIKYCTDGQNQPGKTASRLFAIASSPYESRRDSSLLDASIIEVLVDRRGDQDEAALADMGPGQLLSVSQVAGRGYASLFNSYVGLLSAAEESRPLLMLGMGSRGMGPLRAALEWTPIQAHATANAVSLFYVTECQQSAAYLTEWDRWREAGASISPVYITDLHQSAESSNAHIQDELEAAIFGGDQGLAGALGGDPRECAVLMSGLPGSVVAAITRRFTLEGVTRERILFCDFM